MRTLQDLTPVELRRIINYGATAPEFRAKARQELRDREETPREEKRRLARMERAAILAARRDS